MTDKHNLSTGDPCIDPESALNACREAGLVEGKWCYDVWAGYVRIKSLTTDAVIFVTETGQTTGLNSPTTLYKSYQKDDIILIDR
jgi:hypothetical protein